MLNDWSFLLIFTEPWFWQGLIINASFALVSMPFTSRTVYKIFRNSKWNRIKNALNELKIYCLQQIIKDKHIDKDDFENQLYMIANRYKLDVKDIYNKNIFRQTLIHSILETDLIDDITKAQITNIIRKDTIFIGSDNSDNLYDDFTLSEEIDHPNENDNSDNIQLNKDEKNIVHKYTGIITGIIFIILLMYTFLCQILINAYGNNSIIFINTIIIVFTIIPILVYGIIYFTKFNKMNKIFFGFLLLISILNIINFICIVGILLYNR